MAAGQNKNDTPSNLSRISVDYRNRELARNEYNLDDEYVSGHKNALSDGDAKGKGQTNSGVGNNTDIAKRFQSQARNKYNLNNPYNIDNA